MKQELAMPFRSHRPPATGPSWLRQAREEAWQRFAEAGFPTGKEDMWLGYDKAGLARELPGTARGNTDADPLPAARQGTRRLVLVDGDFRPDLSDPAPDGVDIVSLADATAADHEVVRYHLGAAAVADPFTDLNTALWSGGLLVDVQPDADAGRLHILHVRTGEGTVAFPRVLVHIQHGGSADIIEEALQGEDADIHSIAVTEFALHEGARAEHVLIDAEGPRATRVHGVFARQEKDSVLHQAHLSWGGKSVRHTVVSTLAEPGADCTLAGMSLSRGKQRVDNWSRIDHAVPDTTSREVYHSVLDDESRVRFTGNVLVRRGADRTNADQQNRNLLLSRKALAESTPQLEINADDVKCSHGSTIGRLDEKQLFFLRSRGISRQSATRMLTEAFALRALAGTTEPTLDIARAAIADWFRGAP